MVYPQYPSPVYRRNSWPSVDLCLLSIIVISPHCHSLDSYPLFVKPASIRTGIGVNHQYGSRFMSLACGSWCFWKGIPKLRLRIPMIQRFLNWMFTMDTIWNTYQTEPESSVHMSISLCRIWWCSQGSQAGSQLEGMEATWCRDGASGWVDIWQRNGPGWCAKFFRSEFGLAFPWVFYICLQVTVNPLAPSQSQDPKLTSPELAKTKSISFQVFHLLDNR